MDIETEATIGFWASLTISTIFLVSGWSWTGLIFTLIAIGFAVGLYTLD